MKKTLILTYNKDAYFFPYIKNCNISIQEPIKKKNFINKVLFRIPGLAVFSYSFLKELKKADNIIIFDSAYNWWLGIFLTKIYKKNAVLYYWNTINKMYPKNGTKMVTFAKKIVPVYSFDHIDCKRYELEYAPMVYSKEVVEKYKNNLSYKLKYDLFFLGGKKDRYNILLDVYNKYFLNVLCCKFIIIASEIEEGKASDELVFSRERYSYDEYLKLLCSSKAILDIPQKGQEGLTIRNVESIFFEKKMITTNREIRKYDFYKANNIFILGEDDPGQLVSFLNSAYEPIENEIKEKYEFENWIDFILKIKS